MPPTGPRAECGDCQAYRVRQFNYRRKCGFHLPRGQVRWSRTRLASGYASEKFCGHCGGNKPRGGRTAAGHSG